MVARKGYAGVYSAKASKGAAEEAPVFMFDSMELKDSFNLFIVYFLVIILCHTYNEHKL